MSEATRVVSNQRLISEPMVAAPVVAEPMVFESPVIDPLVVEPAMVDPVLAPPTLADPMLADTVIVEEVVAPAVPAPAIVEPVVAVAPLTTRSVRRSYATSFAPDSVVAAVVGLFLLLVGLLAITRAGFDGPLNSPVVSVLGFTHTTTLGLMEIIIGGCLLISGATRSRSAALFFGSVLGIASFVGAVQTESFQNNLALESGFAWLLVFGGLAVVLAALLLPRYMQRTTVVYPG
jgi:hypothetical protein